MSSNCSLLLLLFLSFGSNEFGFCLSEDGENECNNTLTSCASNAPSVPPRPSFILCNFESYNRCGFHYQSGLLPLLMIAHHPGVRGEGMWALDLSHLNWTQRRSQAPGARLMSQYFDPVQGASGKVSAQNDNQAWLYCYPSTIQSYHFVLCYPLSK